MRMSITTLRRPTTVERYECYTMCIIFDSYCIVLANTVVCRDWRHCTLIDWYALLRLP